MLIAQLTDLHVRAEPDGAKYGIDAAAQLAAAVERVNGCSRAPDLVLVTGDLADEGTDDELARVASLLARLDAPCRVLPGNHDTRDGMRRAFADHDYLPASGHLSWVDDGWPLRVVGLDTTVPGHHHGELDPDRLAWLDEVLSARPDQATLVAMHHPPFDSGLWWMDRQGLLAGRRELRALLGRHRQVVRVVCGHQHRAVQAAWGSVTLSICPSTWSQHVLDLVPESPPRGLPEPGSFQLHQWDGDVLVTHTEHVVPQAATVDFTETWASDWERMKVGLRANAERPAVG
ncbi:MAG: phosphodiesterase [Actinomycetota bacterium]|nr:phosphodiesterase [Actinomycetota bacterium]